MLISVDLPAPLVPITACTGPRARPSETPWTAVSPPKRRVTAEAASRRSDMGFPLDRKADRRAGGCGCRGSACVCRTGLAALPPLRGQSGDAVRQQRHERDDG
ncbi:hypothetical protein G6F55_014210 [Rhizopus delemar]|nr:hypothetical protein G6F55_014210 [Rhizopus delemar]